MLQTRLSESPLPVDEAVSTALEIAEALAEAHERGVVHRDLKPSNIMLTRDGHVKVMDFGLAKHLAARGEASEEVTQTDLTGAGSTLGTVPYMSPEQLKGEEVNGRSDLFSFGILFFEMLAGVHPFRKPNAIETVGAILHGTAPLARYRDEIADVFQHILHKLLAKDTRSATRPPTM